MEKRRKAFVLAVSLVGLTAFRTNAQQNNDTTKTQTLNEVVISATRSENNPMEVGRSISVISNEQIKNSAANSLAEILSQQEGIYIVGTGQTPGTLQSIFTRGSNSNQTTILVDGMKISDPSSTDNSIDLSELSLATIDRIEIVRGSHSTLYGSSAIGGVINIITKKNQSPGIHANTILKAGAFGSGTSLFEESIGLNYTDKSGFYANAEAFNTHVNGLNATSDTITNPNNYEHNHPEKDGFSKTDLFGKLGYRNTKWDVYASCKKVSQKAAIDKGAYNDDDNYITKFQRNLTTYGASYKINEKSGVTYIGGITNLKHLFVDDSSKTDDAGHYDGTYYAGTYKANVSNNELQANLKLKGISGVFGGGLFDEKMTFSSYYYSNAYGVYESKQNLDSLNIDIKTINQFVHIDIDGSLIRDNYKAFAIGLGLRNTRHDLFGSNITFEINPSLQVSEGGLLYASYATGYNAPSLYQLFSSDKDLFSGITRGNKSLKPETSASWEFGFKQKVKDNTTFTLTYFTTLVQNSIDYVYLWNKSKAINALGYDDYRGDTYVNIGRQTNQGIEVTIRSKVSKKFSITGNLSLISGRLNYKPSHIDTSHTQGNHIQLFSNGAFINKNVESIGLVRRPNTAYIGLICKPYKKLSLDVNLKYVGARGDIYYSSALGPYGSLATKSVADYTLLDVITRYSVVKTLSATFRIDNVFNVKYNEIYGYTTRGRGFYLTLGYNL